MADEHLSVNDVLKLIAEPFSGDKRKLKEFCENVEAAYELIDPNKHDLFYKYVRTRITGEARAKLLVRQDADDWASVKAVLKEHYATKRTLDFYACAMFNARQAKHETVATWCSRLDQLRYAHTGAQRTERTDIAHGDKIIFPLLVTSHRTLIRVP